LGLGPGKTQVMTQEAHEALAGCGVVLGHRPYIEQIKHLLQGQKVIKSAMTKELDRAGQAVDLALSGEKVALVSGGESGIYGMAPVVYELAKARGLKLGQGPGELKVKVLPGIPAVAAAAAELGAPLSHDFACISLSDRLTPWELIEKRLSLTAQADLVIALYNPKSKNRTWQLDRALEIIAEHKPASTPVGVVRRARREGQSINLFTLEGAKEAEVDMQTLLIIGNAQSYVYEGKMITPRGYINKYGEGK
jgi:precorrin-3B C17-methyltransferase